MRFLLASLVLTGCSFHLAPLGSSTVGETGHAEFSYSACFFGCKVDQAMMVGTSEMIRVKATSIPKVTLRSTDEATLSIGDATRECCVPNGGACHDVHVSDDCASGEVSTSLSVFVVANAPGSAKLVLDQDGDTFDAVTLDVAQPASLTVSCGSGTSKVALAATASCSLGWTARDASGNALMASTGVTMTTSDAKIADFQATILSADASSITAMQGMLGSTLTAHAPGDATVSANASGATGTLAVHVTP